VHPHCAQLKVKRLVHPNCTQIELSIEISLFSIATLLQRRRRPGGWTDLLLLVYCFQHTLNLWKHTLNLLYGSGASSAQHVPVLLRLGPCGAYPGVGAGPS
jgi:hypothetical protein